MKEEEKGGEENFGFNCCLAFIQWFGLAHCFPDYIKICFQIHLVGTCNYYLKCKQSLLAEHDFVLQFDLSIINLAGTEVTKSLASFTKVYNTKGRCSINWQLTLSIAAHRKDLSLILLR